MTQPPEHIVGINALSLTTLTGGITRLAEGILVGLVDAVRARFPSGNRPISFEVAVAAEGAELLAQQPSLVQAQAESFITLHQVARSSRRLPSTIVAEQWRIRSLAKKRRWKLAQALDYRAALFLEIPQLIVITDLHYIDRPSTFSASQRILRRALVPLSVRKAAAVLAISKSSKERVEQVFPKEVHKITTLPMGHSFDRLGNVGAIPTGLPASFLLTVGTLRPHKNVEVILRALASPALGSWALVVVGRATGTYEHRLRTLASQLRITDRVVFVGAVTDDVLAALYRAAIALVAPSTYEGFGLTILEAFAKGCPVVCSDISAHREAAEGAALYFSPADPASLLQALAHLRDTREREKQTQAGLRQLDKHGWLNTGMTLLNVYQALLEGNTATLRPDTSTLGPTHLEQ